MNEKTKIYVLFVWGHPVAFYPTKERAVLAGKELNEPTSEDSDGTLWCAFRVVEWIEGEDTQYGLMWQYEFEYREDK